MCYSTFLAVRTRRSYEYNVVNFDIISCIVGVEYDEVAKVCIL